MKWLMEALKKMDKTKWLILGLAGMLLLVIAIPTEDIQSRKQEAADRQALLEQNGTGGEALSYERELEQRLAQRLSAMEGAGEVQVMLSFTEPKEKDSYVSRQELPDVEGVLVIAQGGGDSNVKKAIQEAVMALFPLEAHKIKVVKMKSR